MRQPAPVTSVDNALLLMRFITVAMIAGVLGFGVIASIVKGEPRPEPMLCYMALFMAVLCLGVRLVVPDLMARNQIKSLGLAEAEPNDETRARMAGVYQTRQIVGLALCEGPAFFNLIAWWLEGQTLSVATVGCLLLVMVASVPTRGRLEAWIDQQACPDS